MSIEQEETAENGGIRINKYLASCGIESRRAADMMIAEGRVQVNGEIITTPGMKIMPGDHVKADGQKMEPKDPVVILLNKPKGYVCSRDAQGALGTVFDLLPPRFRHVTYVGRLDVDSEGLLLMTNRGDITQMVSHPSAGVEKEYWVTLDQNFDNSVLLQFLRGVRIPEGNAKAKYVYRASARRANIVLEQGLKRQIRQMFERLGLRVRRLIRARIGSLWGGELALGDWRVMTDEEVALTQVNPPRQKKYVVAKNIVVDSTVKSEIRESNMVRVQDDEDYQFDPADFEGGDDDANLLEAYEPTAAMTTLYEGDLDAVVEEEEDTRESRGAGRFGDRVERSSDRDFRGGDRSGGDRRGGFGGGGREGGERRGGFGGGGRSFGGGGDRRGGFGSGGRSFGGGGDRRGGFGGGRRDDRDGGGRFDRGTRPSFNREPIEGESVEKPEGTEDRGERRSFADREGGERRGSFGGGGRSFGGGGDRRGGFGGGGRSFGGGGDRRGGFGGGGRSFGGGGDRRGGFGGGRFDRDSRPSFSREPREGESAEKPEGTEERGERRSFGDREGGERRGGFGGGGDRRGGFGGGGRSFGGGGDRRGGFGGGRDGDRRGGGGGFRKPGGFGGGGFRRDAGEGGGERRSFGDREGGERRGGFAGGGERRSFGDREGGERRGGFSGGRDGDRRGGGGGFRKPGGFGGGGGRKFGGGGGGGFRKSGGGGSRGGRY